MPTMTVAAGSADTETLAAIDELTTALPEGEARAALSAFAKALREGRDVILAGADDSVTPSQAAAVLGVSRAHLYKVLDSGALPFTVVGSRDRRISMVDLRTYVAKTEQLRRDAARTAAQRSVTRARAVDEM